MLGYVVAFAAGAVITAALAYGLWFVGDLVLQPPEDR